MPDIRVTAADGTVHVFPDGTTEAQISQAMGLKPQAAPQAKPTTALPENFDLMWAGAGLPASGLVSDKAERKKLMDLEHQNVSSFAKDVAIAGGSALAGAGVSAGAALLPRALSGLARIGGNAAIGAGAAKLQGADPAVGAMLGGGAEGVGSLLTSLAPRLMATALGVSKAQGGKVGRLEIGKEAINERITPTVGRVEAAEQIRNARMAAVDANVAAQNGRVSILPKQLAANSSRELQPIIDMDNMAGVPTQKPDVLINFEKQAALTPSQLQSSRRVWNREQGNAIQGAKLSGRTPGIDEKAYGSLAKSSGELLESVVPGYKEANQSIRKIEGARQAAANRLAQPGTGLANEVATGAAMLNPDMILPIVMGRTARIPAVAAGAAIGGNDIGRAIQDPRVKAALLALLSAPEPSHR